MQNSYFFLILYKIYSIIKAVGGMFMKTKNICKFVQPTLGDRVETHSFIYETDIATMQEPITLSYNRVILVKSKSITFKIDHFKLLASAGSLIFAFAGENISSVPENDAEYLYIDFSGNRSESLFRRFGINVSSRNFSGFDGLIPIWYDSLSRASSENTDLAAESMLLYTFSRLNSSAGENSNLIQRAIDLTEENFANPELSLSLIAKELSYNEKYLSHKFKEKMGIAYTEYLRMIRIKYAIALFDQGIDSVKNVAFLSGFSNPLYFSKVFKMTVGISPTDYQKKHKK